MVRFLHIQNHRVQVTWVLRGDTKAFVFELIYKMKSQIIFKMAIATVINLEAYNSFPQGGLA